MSASEAPSLMRWTYSSVFSRTRASFLSRVRGFQRIGLYAHVALEDARLQLIGRGQGDRVAIRRLARCVDRHLAVVEAARLGNFLKRLAGGTVVLDLVVEVEQ